MFGYIDLIFILVKTFVFFYENVSLMADVMEPIVKTIISLYLLIATIGFMLCYIGRIQTGL